MSWVQNVYWKRMKKLGWRLILLPCCNHVLVHKSFTGTLKDLIIDG